MALSGDELLALPTLHECIQVQSACFIRLFEHDTRLTAAFATQQRWLMSHIGLALYFRSLRDDLGRGLYLSNFLDAVQMHGVASRNTADSYIKELIKYKYIMLEADSIDRRLKRIGPAPMVIELYIGWLQVHLASLDSLTGGRRLATFQQNPSIVEQLEPLIADGLLAASALRHPEKTFSLFMWLDNGGLVMDWLITNMEPAPLHAERVSVGVIPVADMAARLNLSRTHLSRKLKEAEALGSIGWEGRRGHSAMWVSRGFRLEYATAQAVKLSIIDHACETVMGRAAL